MIDKIKNKIADINSLQPVSSETMDPQVKRIVEALDKNTASSSLNHKTIWRNFVLGIATALGATVGLAIVFAVLGAIIKLAGGFPVVGNALLKLGNYLHK